MRLVIDLQGAQGGSRKAGIGRHAREMALAMARAPGGHDLVVALNGAIPEAAEEVADAFAAVLPRSAIRVWDQPRDTGELVPGGQARRHLAQHLRAQFLASLAPDLVHVTSLFEGHHDDVVTLPPRDLCRLPTVATCYDLIPLVRRADYLDGDPHWRARAPWYWRRLHEMTLCDGLLAISESARREAVLHAGADPARVFNVRCGIAGGFRPVPPGAARTAALRRHGLREGGVLFLGGGDLRKNEVGLIRAYGLLPRALRLDHPLVIVGRADPEAIAGHAAEAGLGASEVRLVPYVEEADLPALYSACAAFVLPSLHEGFGLPAAEAMACGASTLGSDTTSLPEVIGRADALFDPTRPGEIAAVLRRVLEDRDFRRDLSAHGLARAAGFTWAESARRAWGALEAIHDAAARAAAVRGTPCADRLPGARALGRRPSLALVSPLPPQRSGIADYTAELAPALAAHYDVTLVAATGETDDPVLAANFPVLTEEAFRARPGRFDRVLYQVGNSPLHLAQLRSLLPEIPGVVMLHDAFLSDLTTWEAYSQGRPDLFRAELYRAHGWPALAAEAAEGWKMIYARYACSLSVLQQATRVLVHSRHARAALEAQFGPAAAGIGILPLLRATPALPDRVEARARLGLPADAFVVASFGYLTRLKQPELLLGGWHAAAPGDPGVLLAFVGESEPGLEEEVLAAAAAGGVAARVTLTGRATPEAYRDWLAAADVAVQLRRQSRGESSAAVADCLVAGLPVVANAHGAMAELPGDAVLALPDAATADELAAALRALRADPGRRRAMADAARHLAATEIAPANVAASYRDAIEAAHAADAAGHLLRATAALPGEQEPAAVAVARSFPAPRRPHLLIDVSAVWHSDLGTGIQRVVREVSRHALPRDRGMTRVELTRFDGVRLRLAPSVGARVLGIAAAVPDGEAVDAGAGDTLLCLDLSANMGPGDFAELRRLRLAGVRVVVTVYDLLPMLAPHFFPPEVSFIRDWYAAMLEVADGAVCISRTVADELLAWMDTGPLRRTRPLPVGWFHLGSDFRAEAEPALLPDSLRAGLAARPTLAMVGTIEPRKGHAQVLAAMEQLWARGVDVGLVIAGGRGWMVEGLLEAIPAHPEYGRRLHWLERPADTALAALYRDAAGLVMASRGEGFGLPIVEAARTGIPLVLRDIPVFRELAGAHAHYFAGEDAASLAEALEAWLELRARGAEPRPAGIRALDWRQSTDALLRVVLDGEWYRTWTPPAGAAADQEHQEPAPAPGGGPAAVAAAVGDGPEGAADVSLAGTPPGVSRAETDAAV